MTFFKVSPVYFKFVKSFESIIHSNQRSPVIHITLRRQYERFGFFFYFIYITTFILDF